ncbi:MAG: hypothetical protein LC792_09490, partial [Actinobacteria bacterium]|nr:hypothetical protein [Actinomycetota bacterium]
YAITAKGRKALRAWLGEPSAPPRLESEALLRLFFAEHGTKEDLLTTLEELETHALTLRRQAIDQGAEYLTGTAPFPERLPILALVGRFTLDHTTLVADWARWARSEVERWPEVDSGVVSEDVVRAFEAAVAETGP